MAAEPCDGYHRVRRRKSRSDAARYADEILKYRRVVGLLAKAIGWADAGAPFALIAPGPYWRPRRTPEMPDVAPPAA
jgi:hypothetical protein